ncbi:hypothetical protein [Dinoroseobacter sp. PD6]|uniref:hypothetical protein n=1 Tax=Dinoroseobacter sp. PD6 TaxID=3028384 RepID=UPI00308417AA
MDRHIHDHDTGRSEGIADAAFVGGGRVSDPGAGGAGRQPSRHRRRGWIERRAGAVLTLSRRPGARFDLAAATRMPPVAARGRLAHQIRQDLWRALQGLRGFSPVVQVTAGPEGTEVIAGGQLVAARAPKAQIEARIAALLEDPQHRARWLRHAGVVHA